MLEAVLSRLEWLGHETFLYNGPPVIYFSPYELHKIRPADLILVNHEHYHHCSVPDIKKIWRPGTAIVTDQSAARQLEEPVLALEPGGHAIVGKVRIDAVPAYNLEASFHPRSKATSDSSSPSPG